MVPVLVGTLTLLSPITMSLVELLVELLAVLPVVLQQVATAGPVVAAILLAATITFIMSSITWCIDPGIIDFVAPYLRNLKHFCTNLSHHLDCKMNARQELKTKTLEHEVFCPLKISRFPRCQSAQKPFLSFESNLCAPFYSMAGCGGVCYEVDPEAVRTEEKLVYAGAGRGSYQQVSSMEMVGAGKGDFEKEKAKRRGSWWFCMLGHQLGIAADWPSEQLVAASGGSPRGRVV
eukprot:g24855.t1